MSLLKYLKPTYWKFRKQVESMLENTLKELGLERENNRITFHSFEEVYQFIRRMSNLIRITRLSPIGRSVFIEYTFLDAREPICHEDAFLLNLYRELRGIFDDSRAFKIRTLSGNHAFLKEIEGGDFYVIQYTKGLTLLKSYKTGMFVRLDATGLIHVDYGRYILTTHFNDTRSVSVKNSTMKALCIAAYYFLDDRNIHHV